MKKSLVLSLVFILIAAVAGFSADYEFAVSGNASVTWGMDLDFTATGFVNAAEANVEVILVADQTKEKGTDADGAAYGYIKMKDIQIKLKNNGLDSKTPAIDVAKIMIKPVYITIWGKPEIKPDKASILSNLGSKLGIISNADMLPPLPYAPFAYNGVHPDATGTGGIAVGVDTEMVDAELRLMSFGNYVDNAGTGAVWGWVDDDGDPSTPPVWQEITPASGSTLNEDNIYSIGLNASFTIAGFTAEAIAGMIINDPNIDSNFAVGALVKYELDLGGDMKLIPQVGFDLTTFDAGGVDSTLIEVGGGVRLKWAGTYDADKDNHMLVYDGTNKKVFSGLAIGANMATATIGPLDVDPTLNVVVSAYEDSGDDGLLPIVGAALILEIEDLTAEIETDIGVALFVDATINGIRPYASLKALHLQAEADDAIPAGVDGPLQVWTTLGVDIPLFANTTLTLEWQSDDLMYTDTDGTDANGRNGALGDIKVKVKVAF